MNPTVARHAFRVLFIEYFLAFLKVFHRSHPQKALGAFDG